MFAEMFLNEISLEPIAANRLDGHYRMNMFVQTMIAATKYGLQRTLRFPVGTLTQQISPGYTWYDWRNDNAVDKEIRRYFTSVATKAPYLSDHAQLENTWNDTDCYFQGTKASGLKAAYVADGLALSMMSSGDWNRHHIECNIAEISGQDIVEDTVYITHAQSSHHVAIHKDWIRERIVRTVQNGNELWERFNILFPNLKACSEVQKQMEHLPESDIPLIAKGLFVLNVYSAEWQTGNFNQSNVGCRVSTESESTLNQYSNERTFRCPDGTTRVFNWHAKLGQLRIHFVPLRPNIIFIGYVGAHLPITSSN